MTQKGKIVGIYLRSSIIEIIDDLVSKDKETHISRSQFINSAVYRRLKELGKIPKEQTTIVGKPLING